MTSPALELQGAIVARLWADDGVGAIVGRRVFDHVPRSAVGSITATFPFVAISDWQLITEDAQDIAATNIFVDLDCWSRDVGFPEVHRLSEAVKQALHDVEMPLPTNALVLFQHRRTFPRRDPDGLTSLATVTFEGWIEQS